MLLLKRRLRWEEKVREGGEREERERREEKKKEKDNSATSVWCYS